jgi:transposase
MPVAGQSGHALTEKPNAMIINPLSPELNPICHLRALLAHDFLHVSRIKVKSLTVRLLMSYIYMYIWRTYS